MIQIEGLTKKYGNVTVLDSINLSIPNDAVYCLLGKNGAGKTTFINTILDLIKPTHGTVKIFGKINTSLSKSDKKELV